MRGARRAKSILAAALVLALGGFIGERAHAGWLSSLVREAVEGPGGTAGPVGRTVELAPLKPAAAYLEKLSHAPKDALAAHATPEGHWQFINRDGQTFTVGSPEEMQRVLPALVPGLPVGGERKMTLYLSEDSVFANRDALAGLPADANLFVVVDNVAYPLARSGEGADLALKADLAPHLAMRLSNRTAFEETAFLLGRPLNKANIRTIAFEPGTTVPPSSAPKVDPATKVPLVDRLDPKRLNAGFRPLRGQTALVTGRVEGGKLVVAPASGGEVGVPIDRLIAVARDNDVNLIILQSDSSRQAGGRNWLWQTIKIGGLDAAAERATFGDFLDALAAQRGGFLLNAHMERGRIRIVAVPDTAASSLSSDASNVIQEVVSHVTGEVVTNAVDINARNRDAQRERDIRLIPWLPASVQFLYLGGIICGIAGWVMARKWWSVLSGLIGGRNPLQKRGAVWRTVSEFVFFLIFLPIVGFLAFVAQAIHQMILLILAPFRWIKRRFLLKRV